MLIPYDEDRFDTVSSSHTCAFHEANPGMSYAGCTCSSTVSMHAVSDEEYERRKKERAKRELQRLIAKLSGAF